MTDSSATQPPGWYYAQGDPPGTQRYWDGSQWVGGPQAAQGGAVDAGGGFQPSGGSPGQLAEVGSRVIAFLIDVAPIVALWLVFTFLVLVTGSDAGGFLANLFYLAWGIFNFVVKQGQSGQTIGKAQQNIKLVSDETGQPVGAGMAFVRWLLQGVAWFLCLIPGIIDILFPFFDQDRKRVTDKILNMSVVQA
ncbi:MAG: RDD family protein [Actinomycetota bacterium]